MLKSLINCARTKQCAETELNVSLQQWNFEVGVSCVSRLRCPAGILLPSPPQQGFSLLQFANIFFFCSFGKSWHWNWVELWVLTRKMFYSALLPLCGYIASVDCPAAGLSLDRDQSHFTLKHQSPTAHTITLPSPCFCEGEFRGLGRKCLLQEYNDKLKNVFGIV